jgi:CheY-like chemotaxis protein
MNHTLLLVEDNEDDAFFLLRALKNAGVARPPAHVPDGREAIAYLAGEGAYADRVAHPLPAVVFLDLNLPYKTGLQVLEWIRQRPELARIVVIALTSSSEQSDLRRAYQLGANSYIVKPASADELTEIAKAFRRWWLELNRFDADASPAG